MAAIKGVLFQNIQHGSFFRAKTIEASNDAVGVRIVGTYCIPMSLKWTRCWINPLILLDKTLWRICKLEIPDGD